VVKVIKYTTDMDPIMTVGRNIEDPTTRKAFEEMASLILRAVSDVDLDVTVEAADSGTNSYAVAQGTWTRASGHGSYVSCRAASDPIGTLTADATTFNVYLPRSSADKDPCVYSGDILQYTEVGGVKYALGESYLSAKIGTLGELYHDDVPNGWLFCDGSGSTPDLREQFTQGAIDDTEIGDTGGSTTHAHETGYSIVMVTPSGSTPVQSGASSGCSGGPAEWDPGDPLVCNVEEDPRPPWTKVYKIIRVGPSGEIV
jgi:hypothetical protein